MADQKHPDKHIRAAIDDAISKGWRFEKSNGHAFGKLLCPWNDDDCRCGVFCVLSVYSTPRNPEHHARTIRQKVVGCIHLVRETS
jgi:hypothetical protein